MADSVLEPVGITREEEDLYRLLLRTKSLAPAEAGRLSGATPAKVRALLASLEEKGLVSRSAERPPRYMATPPDAAIEVLILRRREGLEQVRVAMEGLREEFRLAAGGIAPSDLVEVITGQQAVAQRARQLQLSATHEVLGIDKPPYSAQPNANTDEMDALARGVRYRVIYDRTAVEFPGKLEEIERSAAAGEQTRVLSNTPMKLVIRDRTLALVPLALDIPEHTAALLLHPSALLDAIVTYFEKLWSEALPFSVAADDERRSLLSPDDRELLALLMSGLQDQVIARQLKVSYRTVQRRVHELMERLGADTRFQAGCLAARHGWLGDISSNAKD